MKFKYGSSIDIICRVIITRPYVNGMLLCELGVDNTFVELEKAKEYAIDYIEGILKDNKNLTAYYNFGDDNDRYVGLYTKDNKIALQLNIFEGKSEEDDRLKYRGWIIDKEGNDDKYYCIYPEIRDESKNRIS